MAVVPANGQGGIECVNGDCVIDFFLTALLIVPLTALLIVSLTALLIVSLTALLIILLTALDIFSTCRLMVDGCMDRQKSCKWCRSFTSAPATLNDPCSVVISSVCSIYLCLVQFDPI